MGVVGAADLVGIEWTLLRFLSDGVESVPGDYPLEITLGITGAGALSAGSRRGSCARAQRAAWPVFAR